MVYKIVLFFLMVCFAESYGAGEKLFLLENSAERIEAVIEQLEEIYGQNCQVAPEAVIIPIAVGSSAALCAVVCFISGLAYQYYMFDNCSVCSEGDFYADV